MSKGWDNTALKKLKALMGKGLSTSEIGKKLGISKNAVVGKLNRLGWNAKAGTVAAKTATEKKTTKSAAPAPAKKPAVKKTTTNAKPTKATTAKAPAVKPTKTTPAKKAAPDKSVSVKAVPAKKAPAPVKNLAPKAPAKEPKSLSNKTLAMHQRIIQHSLEMANLKPNQCRWPIGDPDSENFHFCGETVFVGKPYCYEHCKQAYQFTPPKKK